MFPKIITTSVIRSTQQGESHGGVYLIDLNSEKVKQVIDWNKMDIDWAGRGADRGLRGIAFHTSSNRVEYLNKRGKLIEFFKIKKYNDKLLLNSNIPKDHARQSFGRGLCVYKNYIIVGSSPATISIYKIGEQEPLKSVNISMDVRNAIHGLEIWPFEMI